MQNREDGGTGMRSGDRPPRALGPLLRTLRARRRLFGVIVLVVVVASIVLVAMRTPAYDATAQILVTAVPQTNDAFVGLPVVRESDDPLRPVQTAAALLDDPVIAAQTAQQVGGMSVRDVLHAVTVRPQGGSDVVAVTAQTSSPQRSALLANAYAANAVRHRDALLRTAIRGELATLRSTITRIAASGAAAPGDVEDHVAQLERAQATGDPTLSLAHAAARPISPSGIASPALVGLALVCGAAAGIVAVLVLGEPAAAQATAVRSTGERPDRTVAHGSG